MIAIRLAVSRTFSCLDNVLIKIFSFAFSTIWIDHVEVLTPYLVLTSRIMRSSIVSRGIMAFPWTMKILTSSIRWFRFFSKVWGADLESKLELCKKTGLKNFEVRNKKIFLEIAILVEKYFPYRFSGLYHNLCRAIRPWMSEIVNFRNREKRV